jgi:hypothetical protein
VTRRAPPRCPSCTVRPHDAEKAATRGPEASNSVDALLHPWHCAQSPSQKQVTQRARYVWNREQGSLDHLAQHRALDRRVARLSVVGHLREVTVGHPDDAVRDYGLKPSDIKSERRHKSVATPRAVAMYISRADCPIPGR